MTELDAIPVDACSYASGRGQQILDAVVGGITAFNVSFDGPPTYQIGHTRYVCLCSHGLKPEGSAVELHQRFGHEDSIRKYGDQLRDFIATDPDAQIAWRIRPTLREEGGLYYVYSRLALIGGKIGIY